jgi:hypothetical protein
VGKNSILIVGVPQVGIGCVWAWEGGNYLHV